MNPLLTSGLLTGNKLLENNSLGGVFEGESLLQGETGFQSEFAVLWQQLAATGGKDLPQALGTMRQLRPELVEQLSEQLELSPEQLLALPAPTIEAITDAMEEAAALSQGINIVPGLDATRLFQSEITKSEKSGSNDVLSAELGTGKKLFNAREQFTELLPREALEEINSQREQLHKDKFDVDLMRQISSLKLFTNEVEQAVSPGSLLREVQQGKVLEQLAGIDKPGFNAISALPANGLQTTLQQQSFTQLPRIEVPVGQAQWGQAVGERLMFMANNKVQAASIILNPPELGPIEVKVNLNHDQASVHFVSNHAAVREAIEEAFPRLREMFAQNGLQLADANVSQQSSQQQDQRSDQAPGLNTVELEEDADLQQDWSPDDNTGYLLNDGLVDHYV